MDAAAPSSTSAFSTTASGDNRRSQKPKPPARPAAPRRPRAAPINCHECGKRVLLADRVAVCAMSLHKECFFCAKCGVELTASSCRTVKGQFYCEKHYKSRSDASEHHDKAPVEKTTSSKQHKRLRRIGGTSNSLVTPDTPPAAAAQPPAEPDASSKERQSRRSAAEDVQQEQEPAAETEATGTGARSSPAPSMLPYPGKLASNKRGSHVSTTTPSGPGRASPIYGPRRDGCSLPDKSNRVSRFVTRSREQIAELPADESSRSTAAAAALPPSPQHAAGAKAEESSESQLKKQQEASKPATKRPVPSRKPPAPQPGQSRSGQEKPGQDKPGQDKPGQNKPGQDKPGQEKPGQEKPGQEKPGQGKPGQEKPGQEKPGQGKPGQEKPGQEKPGQDKPGQDKPGQDKPGKPDKHPKKKAPPPPRVPAPPPPPPLDSACPTADNGRQQPTASSSTANQENAKDGAVHPKGSAEPAKDSAVYAKDSAVYAKDSVVYAATTSAVSTGKSHGKKYLPPPDPVLYQQSWAAATTASAKGPHKRPTDLPLSGPKPKKVHKSAKPAAGAAVKPATVSAAKNEEVNAKKELEVQKSLKPRTFALEVPYQESYIADRPHTRTASQSAGAGHRPSRKRPGSRSAHQEIIYQRQKRRAPSVPKHMQRWLGARVLRDAPYSLSDIGDKLEQLSEQQRELDVHGQRLEEKLRNGAPNEERLMKDWLRLVEEKNQLIAKEAELVYMQQDLELIRKRDGLETEIRRRMTIDPSRKTKRQLIEEDGLILQLVETVNVRNRLVNMLDLERLI